MDISLHLRQKFEIESTFSISERTAKGADDSTLVQKKSCRGVGRGVSGNEWVRGNDGGEERQRWDRAVIYGSSVMKLIL